MLKNKDDYKRWRAIISLKNIGDERILPYIIPLVEDKNEYVRLRALEAIGELGGERCIKYIIRCLRDRSEHVRRKAMEIILKFDKDRVYSLKKLLKSKDRRVRKAVAQILSRKGWVPENQMEEICFLIAKEDWVRLSALGRTAIPFLVEMLESGSLDLKVNIIKVLGDIGDSSALSVLYRLIRDEEEIIRLTSVEAIFQITGTVPDSVLELLNDESLNVRLKVIELMGRSGDEKFIPYLKDMLRSKDRFIRRYSAHALENLKWTPEGEEDLIYYKIAKEDWSSFPPSAVDILLEFIDDEDEGVRSGVVEALGHLRNPKCVDALIRKLNDESQYVRWRSAEALGMIKDKRAVEPLISALSDESEYVRWKSAEALGEIGDSRAIEPLLRCMEDESEYVRWASAEALWKIRMGIGS
jgi:HEAT repeat protein